MADHNKAKRMHDAIRAFLASVANGTGPGGFDPMISRRELLESDQIQKLSDAADHWEKSQ